MSAQSHSDVVQAVNLSRVPGLRHAFFTRSGGVSRPPYDTLNVASGNGDSADAVEQNLLRVRRFLGVRTLVSAPQVHGNHVRIVDEATLAGCSERSPSIHTPETDALVTHCPDVGLLIKVADCQAVFVADPENRVIANIHCGWRGSVNGIIPKTIEAIIDHYGCRPEDLVAAIGPSLGPCCAEFIHYKQELPAPFWAYERSPYHFDFWEISRAQLQDAGVPPGNIEIVNRCTVCEESRFFSYRREKITGRLAAVLAWESTERGMT